MSRGHRQRPGLTWRCRRPAGRPVQRSKGAGPSDDGHLVVDGINAALPLNPASPYTVRDGRVWNGAVDLGSPSAGARPKFYDLTTADGVPYEKIAPPARPGRAGHHGGADVHPLRRGPAVPLLRHRGVAARGRDRRGQDPGPAGRGRGGGGPAGRRPADGDDHRHHVRGRPGRPASGPVRARGVPAVPGLPVQVQIEPPADLSVLAELRDGGGDLDRHPRRVDGRRGARALDAGQGDGADGGVTRRPGTRRSGFSAGTGSPPTCSSVSARIRMSWSRPRRADPARRVPVRGAVAADAGTLAGTRDGASAPSPALVRRGDRAVAAAAARGGDGRGATSRRAARPAARCSVLQAAGG